RVSRRRRTLPPLAAAPVRSNERHHAAETRGIVSTTTTVRNAVLAEALGTALLLAVVVGSGIMAERLAGGNAAVALLANSMSTVGGLYVLIEIFGPISGAHFNPAVSLVMSAKKMLPRELLLPYVAAQLAGAMLGVWSAHAMFDVSILQI